VSGFIAVLDCEGAPVDAGQLRACLDVAPFGPDCRVWVDGSVALASAPFRRVARSCGSSERSGEGSPIVDRDGEGSPIAERDVVVVFDGRLDDRAGLCARLATAFGCDVNTASDPQLIAAAYAKWGIAAPEHLLGDFAFCIWDRQRQSLFVARDHFGVKPVYVARRGRTLIVSNVLRIVRRHALVADRLDDEAIGDLLLFGQVMDPAKTPFADISRLAPAHRLECLRDRVPRVDRYWTFRAEAPCSHRQTGDAIEELTTSLRVAVADRLRGGRVGVFMSGGLDSTSVAAMAADVLGSSACAELRAFTGVYESVAADEERRYSSLVADSLKIAIEHLPLDHYTLFERWNADRLPPEPTTEPMTAVTADWLARAAPHGAAVLTGDGGDPLLLPSPFVGQLGQVPFFSLIGGFWRSVMCHDRPPLGIRSSVREWRRRAHEEVPPWLGEPLLRCFDAHDRWHHVRRDRVAHRGARATAINRLLDPWWPSTFETYDPGAIGQPVAMRYPFFDLRLVRVALRLPSFPLCVNKQVLRRAMHGRLPDAVRLRPKTPLAVAPESVHMQWSVADAVRAIELGPGMTRYVDIRKFQTTVREDVLFTHRAPGTLAAVSLATWLHCSSTARARAVMAQP
jgi:asparagine synthase (glutamine-hydrolysing)